jgi:hypothetical protein
MQIANAYEKEAFNGDGRTIDAVAPSPAAGLLPARGTDG